MKGGFYIGCLCVLLGALPARAERVVLALSSEKIGISSNFTGAELTVFGVIERDQQSTSRAGAYDVAVILRGPARSVVTREKQRMFGVWVNGAARTYVAAPSFFALASTRPLVDFAEESVRQAHDLGLDALQLIERANRGIDDEKQRFRAAFIDMKRQDKLYSEAMGAVKFMAPNVFRGRILLPANAPIGIYAIEVVLLNGGQVIGRQSTNLQIYKTGFEQAVFDASRQNPLWYGLLSVVLALGSGWLASVVFRRG